MHYFFVERKESRHSHSKFHMRQSTQFNFLGQRKMETTLEGPDHAPLSCGKAVYLVILLHGKGVDGNNVIDIGIEWGAILNKAKFIAPNGPFPDEDTSAGRQWFGIKNADTQQLVSNMNEASEIVNAYLDEILANHHLDDSHLAIVGFGQGATLALHAALRRGKPMGAIVAISGTVQDAEFLAKEIHIKPPTLLVHGDVDPNVSEASMTETQSVLCAMGVPVQTLSKPGEYWGLEEEGIIKIAEFIRQAMVKTATDHDHDHD